MTPKLTPEQRDALRQHPDRPLRMADDETSEVYLLVSEKALPRLWEDYVRREVERGVEQLDRGESAPWDVEAFLEEIHRRHPDRKS